MMEDDPTMTVTVPVRTQRGRKAAAARLAETEEMEEASEEEAKLQSAMNQILRASRDSKNVNKAQAALDTFRDAVSGLSDEAFRLIMGNSEVEEIFTRAAQTSGVKPGDPVYDQNGRQMGTVPYSYEDFCEIYPMHTWIPQRTDRIEVNGVALQVYEGLETRAPKIFYDVQREAIMAEREAVTGQRATLENSPARYADGITHEVGWYKESPEELVRKYGVER